jgi:hypothetical protein
MGEGKAGPGDMVAPQVDVKLIGKVSRTLLA